MSRTMHWYKAYPSDFFDATRGWNSDKKGSYRLLLDLIYMHDGRVSDDGLYIASQLGLSSKRKWTVVKNWLENEGKIKVENGYISNYRADIEILSAKKQADKFGKSNKNKQIKSIDTDTDITPNPLQGDLCFNEFWEAYPKAARQDRTRAKNAWDALTDPQRQAAFAALPSHSSAMRKADKAGPTPATYLKAGWWEKYTVAPPAEIPADGTPAKILFDAIAERYSEQAYHNIFADALIEGVAIRMSENKFERGQRFRDAVKSAGFKMELAA